MEPAVQDWQLPEGPDCRIVTVGAEGRHSDLVPDQGKLSRQDIIHTLSPKGDILIILRLLPEQKPKGGLDEWTEADLACGQHAAKAEVEVRRA
jgi:hypothetical protein